MDRVFFDLDDTLYDQLVPFEGAYREVFGARFDASGPDGTPLDVWELFRASRRHSDEAFAASERGEMPMEEMHVYRLKRAFADFGIEVGDADCLRMQGIYAAAQESDIRLSPAVVALLDWCAGNLPPGIITNGPAVHQRKKMEALGLGRWVGPDDMLVSSEVGVAKPDPRIFRMACERVGTKPEHCVFVGDSFGADVVGAVAAGMLVVWLNRRGNAMPEGPDVPRPTWVASREEELLGLLSEAAEGAR